MAERDFTFNIKINGRDELDEIIKEMKQFVQTSKEAQELIKDLTRRCGYDVKDIAGRLAGELERAYREVRDEIQKKRGEKEELDLPHEILKLIFNKFPEGITVGEITSILNEARKLVDETLIV